MLCAFYINNIWPRLVFISDKQHHIVSNKVEAAKVAWEAAKLWIREEQMLLPQFFIIS